MSEKGATIIKAVREAAERNPSNADGGSCQYVADGEPACLVGHALWDLGLIDPSMEYSNSNGEGVDTALSELGIDVDHTELVWLEVAQTAQDTKHSWREAVRQADEFDPGELESW